jgi:hypothetical protein
LLVVISLFCAVKLGFKEWLNKEQLDNIEHFFLTNISVHLRTEVWGDFNIHGTKYFEGAIFHQKSASCTFGWPKKSIPYMKY